MPTIETLSRRLQELESQNRRFKLALLGILVLVGPVLFASQGYSQPDQKPKGQAIAAKSISIIDGKGRTRAFLGMREAGAGSEPCVAFYDEKEKLRVWLGVSNLGGGRPELTLHDGSERIRVDLGTDQKMTSLGLLDDAGARRLMLVLHEGEPGISLSDENRKDRIRIWAFKKGGPGLAILDEEEKRLFSKP